MSRRIQFFELADARLQGVVKAILKQMWVLKISEIAATVCKKREGGLQDNNNGTIDDQNDNRSTSSIAPNTISETEDATCFSALLLYGGKAYCIFCSRPDCSNDKSRCISVTDNNKKEKYGDNCLQIRRIYWDKKSCKTSGVLVARKSRRVRQSKTKELR